MLTDNVGTVAAVPAPVTQPEHPSRIGLWVLSVALGASYVMWQFAVLMPALVWLLLTGQIRDRQDVFDTPLLILAALAALGISALITSLVAVTWPSVWRETVAAGGPSFAGWLGWRGAEAIPMWAVPFLTIAVQVTTLLAVTPLADPSDVNVQSKLFATTEAQILGALVVTTVVPVAEELIFRGALFNALLGRNGDLPFWRRTIAPVIITSVLFAAAHRVAGIDTLAGMVQITFLSFYLGWLRAVTGSVKSTVVAHVTWNAVGALALIAINLQV